MGAPGVKNLIIGIVVMFAGYFLKGLFGDWGLAFAYYVVEFIGLVIFLVGAITFFKSRSNVEPGSDGHLALRNEVLLKCLARMTYADTNTKAVEVEAVRKIYKKATGKTLKDAEIRVAARGDLHEPKAFDRYLSSCQSKLTAEDKTYIIKAMADVVKSDGSVSPGEIEFFDQVGKCFKLNPSEIVDLKK